MAKNILITGGAGFVGSYLCNMLFNEGENIVAIDDLSNGTPENIDRSIKFIKADITTNDFISKLADYTFDIVIHCAAQSSNELSFIDSNRDMMVNQLGTLNLLNYCKKNNIERIIFTSSMSVYGQSLRFPSNESDNCHPDSFYAIHKLASEQYLRIYSSQYNIKYTIFRLYTTYGHGQNLGNKDQGLISIYLSYLINQEPLIVKGLKSRKRDIIHVSDVAKAIKLSLRNPKSYNKLYNLGTGVCITIDEIIRFLIDGLGYKYDQYNVSFVSGTPGDPLETLADISEIKKDLNWAPIISAEEGIRLTLKNYLENEKIKD